MNKRQVNKNNKKLNLFVFDDGKKIYILWKDYSKGLSYILDNFEINSSNYIFKKLNINEKSIEKFYYKNGFKSIKRILRELEKEDLNEPYIL